MDLYKSDIRLSRGDIMEKDRKQVDQEEQLIQAKKDNMNLILYVQQLERQLSRFFTLNPQTYDMFIQDKQQQQQVREEDLSQKEKEQHTEMAQLLSNSTLIKSYEQIIQQYEQELDKKNNLIKDMERELQQIQYENSNLSQQLYNLKCNMPQQVQNKEEGQGQIEKDTLVELLKRNHDVVMEKYEIQRQRNDMLEKTAIEKEKLYNEIKIENDQLANSNYKLQRSNEDLNNEKKILESKLKNSETNLKQSQEELRSLRVTNERLESQVKIQNEELEVIQKSYEELSIKKQNEMELLTREVNQLAIKDKDQKQRIYYLEKEIAETKDVLRQNSLELEARTRENDHLVSLLEDQEQKISLYEQKEKSIQQLAIESKKRIEESNSERDRVLLKEQQYLRQIARLEDTLKSEHQEKQERHDKIIESLRSRQKTILDQKDDEISDLRLKLSDQIEQTDRYRIERDSLRNELEKIQDQVRILKDEASMKYETYSKQISQTESQNIDRIRNLQREVDILKEENEGLKRQQSQTQIQLHEQEIKLDGYMRDYERYFEENKRLRELINNLREEKDTALSELKRLKNIYHDRVNEINDECNLKIAHLENQLLESKERHKFNEEKAFEIMMMQEKIAEKWKNEHKVTVDFFEKQLKALKTENRNLHEKVIELKGLLKIEKENHDSKNISKRTTTTSKTTSKSQEREKEKKTASK